MPKENGGLKMESPSTPALLQVHVCYVLLCGCEYMYDLYCCVAASTSK